MGSMGGGILELCVVSPLVKTILRTSGTKSYSIWPMVTRLKLDFNVSHILFYKEVQFSCSVMSDSL